MVHSASPGRKGDTGGVRQQILVTMFFGRTLAGESGKGTAPPVVRGHFAPASVIGKKLAQPEGEVRRQDGHPAARRDAALVAPSREAKPELEGELFTLELPELDEVQLRPASSLRTIGKARMPIEEYPPACLFNDFQISFTKLADEPLGVRAWDNRGNLCVMAVIDYGPIDRWNMENASPVLRPGAIIYEISSELGGSRRGGMEMAMAAKGAQHLTIKARYYTKKVVRVMKPMGSILGIHLFTDTTVIQSIDESTGVMIKHIDEEDEGNLALPGDCITHVNGLECTGDTIVHMLWELTGMLTLTISNPGCVLADDGGACARKAGNRFGAGALS